MVNDRPVQEIAQIIYSMHCAKKSERCPIEVKKLLDQMEYDSILNQIEEEDYTFDTPFCDKQYFPMLRD